MHLKKTVYTIQPFLTISTNRIATTVVITMICLLSGIPAHSQKYDFVNLNIEHGLVQSQINNIAQDQFGMLWIATLGGISRFDGKEFSNFNYGKGLVQSMTEVIYPDRKNRIWIGQESSIQLFEGQEFKLYNISCSPGRKNVVDLTQAPDGDIYTLIFGGQLCKLSDSSRNFNAVYKEHAFTAITSDSKDFYSAIYKKGIFQFVDGHWDPFIQWHGKDTSLLVRKLYLKKNAPGLWALTNEGLFNIQDGKKILIPMEINGWINCLEEDPSGALYVGTNNGAYKIRPNSTTEKIGLQQGLTDNAIHDIFTDHEGNIWFGSDGSGLFKFHDATFRIFDHASGLQGEIIMALSQSRDGSILAGLLEGGLSKIKNGHIEHINFASSNGQLLKINCLLTDHSQKLWIGTIGSGLWTYYNNKFTQIAKDQKGFPRNFTSIYEASDSSIWLTSPRGVHKIDHGKILAIESIQYPCFITHEIGRDSILIGSTQGLYLLDKNLSACPYPVAGAEGMLVGSIQTIGKYLALGTSENGVLIKEISGDKTWVCNESNGLSSNMVFSILQEGSDLYAGTINGLNKLSFDHTQQRFTAQHIKSSNQRLGPECNQNAILKDEHDRIWVGTTKGIYIYDPDSSSVLSQPKIFLKAVDIYSGSVDSAYSRDQKRSAWNWIPQNLHLDYKHNHLTFTVQGVHLSSPEDLRYQYFLAGADTAYSPPRENPSVIYPNLSPGKYTFKARAIVSTNDPVMSPSLSYAFEIVPPYYQTTWFRFSMVGLLILLGALLQKYRMMLKARQARLVQEARKQEQLKIQQRTSEDLHDDLGNKITRLSLLTDVLQTKLKEDDADLNKLMVQIKENIQGLYMGTKDIIWALAPNHNTLYEAISRVQSFGTELFQESSIHFKSNDIDPAFKTLKPPFEFSRNLIMVCKEALHNILKHAQGQHASLDFVYQHSVHDAPGTLKVIIKDDGLGFDTTNAIKKGNGLDNMQKRIHRLGGHLSLSNTNPTGTTITIELNIPLSEG